MDKVVSAGMILAAAAMAAGKAEAAAQESLAESSE